MAPKTRRRFSPSEKLRLVQAGRQQLGTLGAPGLEPRQRGRKPKLGSKERQLAAATKALAVLQRKLQVATAIIALQTKAHEVLGLALPEPDETN